jgi:hypothetical protein
MSGQPPEKTCWCGCGTRTRGSFAPGHDRVAINTLLKLLYGPTDTAVRFLEAHGYGPSGSNLHEECLRAEARAAEAAAKAWVK